MKIEYPIMGAEYIHYKGGRYKVVSMAKHTETDEVLVIYTSIEFGSFHARPLNLFMDRVDNTQRFKLIEPI